MTINMHIISGNLVRDPDIRESASGNAWATFTVAVNVREKDQTTGEWKDVPSFFDCKCFGRLASSIVSRLSKGSKVVVQGSMEQETYTDRKSGETRKSWKLIADEVTIMSGTAPIAGAPEATEAVDAFYEEAIPF